MIGPGQGRCFDFKSSSRRRPSVPTGSAGIPWFPWSSKMCPASPRRALNFGGGQAFWRRISARAVDNCKENDVGKAVKLETNQLRCHHCMCPTTLRPTESWAWPKSSTTRYTDGSAFAAAQALSKVDCNHLHNPCRLSDRRPMCRETDNSIAPTLRQSGGDETKLQ